MQDVVSEGAGALLTLQMPEVVRMIVLELDGVDRPELVASEQVTAALVWAARAGMPVERWYIGCASAGGNLAAGAALRLRDAGMPVLSGVVLAYPLLHKRLPPMSSELQAKYEELPVQERFSRETVDLLNRTT